MTIEPNLKGRANYDSTYKCPYDLSHGRLAHRIHTFSFPFPVVHFEQGILIF